MEYKSQHQDSGDDFWCNIFPILDHQVQDPGGRYFAHQAKTLVEKNNLLFLGYESLQTILFLKFFLVVMIKINKITYLQFTMSIYGIQKEVDLDGEGLGTM